MAADSFSVVDVDAHYTGHLEHLVEYIEEGPRKDPFADSVAARQAGSSAFDSNKGFWPRISSAYEAYRKRHPTEPNPFSDEDDPGWIADTNEEVVATMDELGIDDIVLLGNQMITMDQIRGDDERPVLYTNAYVDFMLDRIVDPDDGVYTMVPVPHHDPQAAVELIDRVKDEPGIIGICFVSGKIEPPLGNRKYDPIYEAAEDAGLPIAVHGETAGVDNFHLAGYETKLSVHTLSFVWANTAQLTSMLVQGVPEKFPDLEFVFQECGIFWVPMMMYRLDGEYLSRPAEAPLLEQRPSEYMKESFYYGTQPLEEVPDPAYFEYVIEMLGGPERLMYASDYPHSDYDQPSAITDLPFLSEGEKAQVLGGTAREVFDL